MSHQPNISRKRRVYSDDFKLEVVQYAKNNKPKKGMSGHYNVARTLVIEWTDQEEDLKSSRKCYYMDNDLTIPGAEYRRELALGHKDCAKSCIDDPCCMAYEWTIDGVCLFKSKSLNGTVGVKPGVRFGLCFVKDDPYKERDHFYDHELGGKLFASSPILKLDQCARFCQANKDDVMQKRSPEDDTGNAQRLSRLGYSWCPTIQQNEVESETFDGKGTCSCVEVLHYVKLSFGSASGYL